MLKKVFVFFLCFSFYASQAQNTINRYEYWFDDNYAAKVSRDVPPQNTLQLISGINTSALKIGLHIFNIRFKDERGIWSSVLGQHFFKANNSVIPNSINGYRYWIDSDTASITTVDIAVTTNPRYVFEQINLANLDTGRHLITMQFRDLQSIWSSAIVDTFYQLGKPHVDNVTPNKGGNTGDVSVMISGTGFYQGTSVKLTRIGYPDIIVPDSVTKITNGQRILATLDLRGRALGHWNVVITIANDTVMTLLNAFEIIKGSDADVWARISGFGSIRANQWQTYTITYGNNGNIDARGVPIWIAIPPDKEIEFDFERLRPQGSSLNFDTIKPYFVTDTLNHQPFFANVYGFYLPIVPSSFTGSLTFRVKTKTPGNFQIKVWVSPPFYGSPLKYYVGDCADKIIGKVLGEIPVVGCIYDLLDVGLSPYFDYYYDPNSIDFKYVGDLTLQFGQTMFECYKDVLVAPAVLEAIFTAVDLKDDMELFTTCGLYLGQILSHQINVVNSVDPNEKVGPGLGGVNYIPDDSPLFYEIYFENADSATAAAQTISVIDTLDAKVFNLSSFEFGHVTLGDTTLVIQPGSKQISFWYDMRPRNKELLVHIEGKMDIIKGVIKWTFNSLDPSTMLQITNPFVGLLPPNKNKPEGQGIVSYSIHAKDALANNTTIKNKAHIYFDNNAPVVTNEWFNTIDNIKPQSLVHLLPAYSKDSSFKVNWSGTDISSGVMSYTIYVSVNGGNYFKWLVSISDTIATFPGKPDSTYRFYSIATDSALNVEAAPSGQDAITTVKLCNASVSINVSRPTTFCQGDSVQLTSSSTLGNQWFKDSTAITGATNSTYMARTRGSYTVKVTNANDCVSTSIPTVVEVNPTPAKPIVTRNGAELVSSSATGNQWFASGIAITGANSQTFRPSASGRYSVQTTESSCSSFISDEFDFLIMGISDPTALENTLLVFPNPTTKKITIISRYRNPVQVQLLDITGRKVTDAHKVSSILELPTNHLANGTYILFVIDEKTKKTWRKLLIKQ